MKKILLILTISIVAFSCKNEKTEESIPKEMEEIAINYQTYGDEISDEMVMTEQEMVEKYKCGFYVDPEIPQELADIILYLKNNPELNKELGRNSRRLAESVYDKSILCRDFVNVVHSLELK